MRMQCHCDKRRIPFGAIETTSNTDSDSSVVATETIGRAITQGALCRSQVSVDTAICDHPSHKICNSISEMNAAVQFALASSGHSEGCHHIRLLQPRLNAVQQNLHSGMPNGDKLGFTKFQFQLLFSSFCSQQPSCLAYIVLDDRSPVRL